MRPALNAGLAACCFGLDGVLHAACLLSPAWSPGVLAFGAVTWGEEHGAHLSCVVFEIASALFWLRWLNMHSWARVKITINFCIIKQGKKKKEKKKKVNYKRLP